MNLTILMAIPLVGAVVVWLFPRGEEADARVVKGAAVAISAATLAASLWLLAEYDTASGGMQFAASYDWIPQLGVTFSVGVDGIALALVLLTTILTPVVLLAAWRESIPLLQANSYFAWLLLLEGLAIGVFAATDVFLFYVLFEATLIPIYFLIGAHGTGERSAAATKFLLYNLTGGLLMLASLVGIYAATAAAGQATFQHTHLVTFEFDQNIERLLFLGFFAAFAVKAPLWPWHTWLPDAAASATPSTSILMVSVIDKVGTFAMIRWCLEVFPGASQWASPVVIVLALISILYGALLAIGENDLRRLVALTSVSHFGFIVLGIFVFTTVSTAGSVLYMFNHGLSTALLFLATGVMIARRGSADISDFGGVQKIAPVLSGILLIAGLSTLSLPGLAPFVSELMVLVGSYSRSIPVGVIATLGIVGAAVYVLRLYRRTMTGPLTDGGAQVADLTPIETAAMTPLVVLVIGLGLFPQPLLNVINPAVETVVSYVSTEDPPPLSPPTLGEATAEGADQ